VRGKLPLLLLGAVTLLCLAGLFSGEIFDPDFWWHLKTGQFIVQQHRLPVPDPFSYTTAGARPGYPGEEQTRYFNLTHEWLAQLLLYCAWRLGSFPAVVLLRALIMASACLIAGMLAARRSKSFTWGVAAALAAASVALMFATDRPGVASYLFVMIFLAVMESRRGIWFLPLLSVIWANCHGGFFLAWIVCGAYAVEAVLRKAPHERRLVLVTAAVFLVSGLNPNGFGIIPTMLRYRQSYMTSTIIEWRHADLWGDPYGYDILLYLSVPVLAIAWRRVKISDWLLFAFFAWASLTAFRNEIYLGLFAPILIAGYWPWKRPLPDAVRYAAAAALAGALVWGVARGSFFRLRAGEWRYPAGAADFLRSHKITAPVFNTYFIGGYLIWKGHSTFIDGRALSETVFRDYRTIIDSPPGAPERRALLARYGAGAIVMDSYEYLTGAMHGLVRAMAYPDMADWKLAYEDPQSMVFLRDLPAGVAEIPKARIADHLESECRNLVEHDPKYPDCALKLGYLVARTNPQRAARMFALYFDHGGTNADARRTYQELLLTVPR
jgi:hypothetical protein